ncbi:NADP-dependent oxidoreductase [Scleromatobacter humisilvae]|uniref:NADP-dependent oxidoreductase n=1 Tax=Scleromatobacter humisilvae TaxID=2897159 RepID=A0A9X1YN40_9BURK|nr:NADP-dependent oxidoreductase [Scleromatobacter humisilvae]MCK9688015.1 NADP-dependent oxidoreductase [Scleromatobacter humisilvae]
MPTLPRSMHALLIRRFGGPEVVEYAEIPVPVPRDGELLLKVEAASLNPVDWKIRSGKYPAVTEAMLPFVLGRDLSATVVSSNDAELVPGTLVHGLMATEHGSFAQYVVASASELAPVPAMLDRIVAAAVPLAGLTAWQGLFDHGGLRAGQRVLIHAGAGGVGHMAVQFAKARGATVIATASTDDVEFVRGLGADQVIDYKKQRFDDHVRDLDLVYDLIGGETQERSWPLLKKGGTLVCTVAEPPQDKAQAHGVKAMRYTAQPRGDQLREIDALIQAGKVKPHLARKYAFGDAKEALRTLEGGHTTGKLVFDMTGAIADVPNPIYKPGD